MQRSPSLKRHLTLGAGVAALVALVLALALVHQLRERALQQHLESTRSLAQSVGQTLDGLVGNIDYVLQVSADEIAHRIAHHETDAAAINRFLGRQQDRFPHIDLLRATNAQGEAVWGLGVDPAQRASLAQRDYYKRLRDDPRAGMVIAEPIVGRISQRWIWLMARRIDGPDGSFAGLVYASMFIDDLVRTFEQIRLPPGSTISLRDAQMRSVARTTFDASPPLPIGDTRHSDELKAALQASAPAGSYVSGATTADGVPRLYAYRRNATHGYTLLVGVPMAVVAAQWQGQAAIVAACLAAFLAGLVYFVKATLRRGEQEVLAAQLADQSRDRALLESLVRTIPDLVWLKDPQGVYLACNEAFERFVGRPGGQIVGRTDFDIVDREQADAFRSRDRAVLESGQAATHEEWITYASDGRRALLKTIQTPMRAPDGSLQGVLGIGHDITEQRRNEDALRDSREQLDRANAGLEQRIAERTAELQESARRLQDTQFAMDSVGIGIAWVDYDSGRFIWTNRRSAEFLGYTVDEYLRLAVPDIDPNFQVDAFDAIRQRIREEGYLRFETEQRAKDGRLLPVEMTVYHDDRDPSRSPRMIAFMSDIAARKEAERALVEAKAAAESANLAKSTFLANMSHEIRTPLNAMLGLAHLLRAHELSPEQAERLDKMDSAGRHLLSIINDILDLSKVEAGRLQLETANFHLSAVLDHVHSMMRESAAAKGLQLESDPDGVPHWLRGDSTRLRQALLNFAGNAVKFTDRGRILLRALLLEDRGDELLVRFEVHDSGPGLSAAQRERLFQPFEQVDASAARRHGGTGLGLALTRRLVELMKGSTGVDSVEGRGSVFWFTVPLQRGHGPMPELAVPGPAASSEQRLRASYRGARVLLAEDNEINIEVVQEMLHAVGLDVTVADDGRKAVERASEGGFQLILMDMQMPEMDGLEATRRIRRLPQYARTPILALTANAFTDDRQACLDAGMDTMLTKPIDPSVLYDAVLHALAGAATRPPASSAAAAPVAEAVPPTLLERLAVLSGVELEAGLRRVGGREARYIALVEKFVATHGGDGVGLADDLAAGRAAEARRRLHQLAGAAAVLGLVAVQQAAAATEALLAPAAGRAADDPALAAAMARLGDALATIVRTVT